MFKNINWKKAAIWALNAILALIGGAGAGYVSTSQEEAPVQYEAQVLQGDWDSPLNYRITASFYKESPVKVANFTDAKVEQDGLGVHTVYVSEPTDMAAIKAFSALTGYTKVGITKKIKTEKRPGFKEEKEPEDDIE